MLHDLKKRCNDDMTEDMMYRDRFGGTHSQEYSTAVGLLVENVWNRIMGRETAQAQEMESSSYLLQQAIESHVPAAHRALLQGTRKRLPLR